ncbi:serine hydrolase domain-containing protein [Nocardia sp. NPDC004151]|uniref:serine hydrolase domain-containing protein n=1 Tax=Nocardia sp. NPDC004151 TaxID=3364304 RepID=UPI00367E1D9E
MTTALEDRPPAPARSRARRYGPRVAVAFALVVALTTAAAWAGTAILNIPGPLTLYRLETAPPSQQGVLFASRTAAASGTPRPLPVRTSELPGTVPWKQDRIPVGQFLDTTKTNAFVVVRDGAVAYEWYRDGVDATTRLSSWSLAKSLVSLLVGRAIDAGKLRESDRLGDLLPELRTGTDYDSVTVGQLLDMTSGVDVGENYNKYLPLSGTARMYLTEDLPGFLRDHRGLRFTPGSTAEYRSVDTQLLGQIMARVEGKPLTELFERDIWGPMGAQDSALWNLDHDGGQEKAFCCFNATARDYAKIGQLVLDGGRAGGAQIIPPAWITRIGNPAPHQVDGWGYSAQWWHPVGGDGADLSAVGVYGQYIYVDPPSHTVIVKLSDYGTGQDELDTIAVFRDLARAGR